MTDQEQIPVVQLAGRLDVHTYTWARALMDAVVAGGAKTVRLDLSPLQTMTNRGLTAVVGCAAEASKRGCELELVGVQGRVLSAIEATGLESVLSIQGPT